MCESCWVDDYGLASLDSGTIRRAVALITMVYDAPNGYVGGGLHIVISDWNLEDDRTERDRKRMRATPLEHD